MSRTIRQTVRKAKIEKTPEPMGYGDDDMAMRAKRTFPGEKRREEMDGWMERDEDEEGCRRISLAIGVHYCACITCACIVFLCVISALPIMHIYALVSSAIKQPQGNIPTASA